MNISNLANQIFAAAALQLVDPHTASAVYCWNRTSEEAREYFSSKKDPIANEYCKALFDAGFTVACTVWGYNVAIEDLDSRSRFEVAVNVPATATEQEINNAALQAAEQLLSGNTGECDGYELNGYKAIATGHSRDGKNFWRIAKVLTEQEVEEQGYLMD